MATTHRILVKTSRLLTYAHEENTAVAEKFKKEEAKVEEQSARTIAERTWNSSRFERRRLRMQES